MRVNITRPIPGPGGRVLEKGYVLDSETMGETYPADYLQSLVDAGEAVEVKAESPKKPQPGTGKKQYMPELEAPALELEGA